jgi:rubredoxin
MHDTHSHDRRCPDCDVSMEQTEFIMANAHSPQLKTNEERDGLLGRLGLDEVADIETVVCPECGLVRFYADAGTTGAEY